MRITFESGQENNIQNTGAAERNYTRTPDKTEKAEKNAEKAAGFSVNIGKQEKTDGAGTYKKEEMTAEELSAQLSGADMDVQKMYMAVMSNSMSVEDFTDMAEDGYNVSDIDIETAVTILDRIKVAVAKGGTEIDGFTDAVSKETLKEILGSSAYAETLEKGIDSASMAYMVDNKMEPTAENLYKAKYSSGGDKGAYAQKEKWNMEEMPKQQQQAFQEQIDRVIEQAGLTVSEESREDAAFLLAHDIPLTKENMQLYEKLKPFGESWRSGNKGGEAALTEEELKYRIALQVYEGKSPETADLSRDKTIYEEAVGVWEQVQGITQEAAEEAVRELNGGEDLTIKKLAEKQAELSQEKDSGKEKTPQEPVQSRELITARRQLEEVRLSMTVEANIKLLRSGYQIDVAPMEELIDALKIMEQALQAEGTAQLTEAVEKLSQLQSMPAAALSFAISREITFTVEALHEKGSSLQKDYERAQERYETMQTMPRADMGDSMQKAFRNVDEILADMGKEPSEENRRAVRMLGYNNLEISEENLERARSMDEKLQRLFRDMKPGRVLKMIREGVDVLHTDIAELDEYLNRQESDFAEQNEEFGRFLNKLDHAGEITPEERESYIGIYRLLRQVEKADGAAGGYLLGSEAELTLENLLTAVRSGKRKFVDYRIDEEFSGVDSVREGLSIIEQIQKMPVRPDREAYEEIKQALSENEKNRHAEQDVVRFLESMNQPVTVSNMVAASAVLQENAGIYQQLEEYERTLRKEEEAEAEQSRFEEYTLALQESLTDEESARNGVEDFAARAEELLRRVQEEKENMAALDIRSLRHIYTGIRFSAALARESRYQIPVKLEAGYTMMNLTIRHRGEQASAEISMKTEVYGRLEAVFTESGSSIRGSFFAETESGTGLLEKAAGAVKEAFDGAGVSVTEIQVIRGTRTGRMAEHINDKETGQEKSEISTKELYQIAKIFLKTVRNEY